MRDTYNSIVDQLPEYIRSNEKYAKFIEFLEEYYKTIPNLDVVVERGLDETLFLDKFVYELALNFKEVSNISEDKQRLLLSKLKDLYKSKGSVESYKTLFHILYDTEIEVVIPAEQIFKPSAAKWNKDVSVRFKIESGFLSSFENILAKITTDVTSFDVDITKISKVNNTTDTFEAFISRNTKLDIKNGGKLIGPGFVGTLVETITSRKMIRSGSRFSIGDVFEIQNGTKIKITKVTPTSGIKSFDIIKFGTGYTSSFITQIVPLNVNIVPPKGDLLIQSTSQPDLNIASNNNIGNISERVILSKFNYTSGTDYFVDNTYVGQLLIDSDSTTFSTTTIEEDSAIIQFNLGYVLEYPGYYSTNVGFTSDASYLQDGDYYQQFSYEIKSNKQFDEYRSPILNLLHPAGLKLFSNYNIDTQVDIIVDIINRLNKLETALIDSTSLSEDISKIVMKNVVDEVKAFETISKTISKFVSVEEISTAETIIKNTLKVVQEQILVSELIFKETQKNITDLTTTFEVVRKTLTKNIQDSTTASNYGVLVNGVPYVNIDDGQYWDAEYAENEVSIT